jgi:hypothetical protein
MRPIYLAGREVRQPMRTLKTGTVMIKVIRKTSTSIRDFMKLFHEEMSNEDRRVILLCPGFHEIHSRDNRRRWTIDLH